MNYKCRLKKNIFDSKTICRQNSASQYVLSSDTNLKIRQTLPRSPRYFRANKIKIIHTINDLNLKESFFYHYYDICKIQKHSYT